MSVAIAIFVALHLLGMAAIIGTFFVQMRAKTGFATPTLLAGAITQLVSGIVLIGLVHGSPGFDWAKYITHGVIGIVVLAAAIGAAIADGRHKRVGPFFHTAGGLALVNLLIAVLWRNYS